MRRIFLAMLLVVGITTIAQERKMKNNNLSSEERTELQVKKMTLDLDLNETQQAQIKTLLNENAKAREAKMAEMKKRKESDEKPSKEEIYKKKSERLDSQIEFKSKMKKILNEKQMEKWETQQKKREEKLQERKDKQIHKREMR